MARRSIAGARAGIIPGVDAATRRLLDAVNRRFYAEHASEFSATRGHPWPGWSRVIQALPVPADRPLRVLDVGCGNGRLAMFLAERWPGALEYTGVDSSSPLLEEARRRNRLHTWVHFLDADFVTQPPDSALPSGRFDCVAVFGVLHHVPGFERRRALLEAGAARLAAGGHLCVSLWRFLESERLRSRLLDWSEAGVPVDRQQLEPGDHLLRWGDDRKAFRFCHHVGDAEWARLVRGLPLRERTAFDADGASGQSNRYAILERTGG